MKKYRLERIEKEVCRVIGKMLYEDLKNPKITGLISVTRARVTPDLKYADIYVSIMNSKNPAQTLEGLVEIQNLMRKRIAGELQLRYTPQVRVKEDDSIEYGIRLSKIINGLDIKHPEEVAGENNEDVEESEENAEK